MNSTYLVKEDPSRNMHRFYALTVTPTLFGDWALIREWGRIGQAGTMRQVWFDDEDQATAAAGKAAKRKKGRGYRIPAAAIKSF